MQQLEFKFFWPLTEQIPLELDYTNCAKPNFSDRISTSSPIYVISNGLNKSVIITGSNFVLDVEKTIIKTQKEIPLYRKMLYKLLGFTWERK
jgi:hypothetical protein